MQDFSSKSCPELRQARKVDASAIHALLWTCRKDIPLTDKFINDEYREWVEGYCKRRAVWVVELDNEIVGAMIMQAYEIFYLVVSPNHRRVGVAQTLIAQAKRYACNKRWHTLKAKANPNNLRVQNLLKKEDFHLNWSESDLKWSVFYWKR